MRIIYTVCALKGGGIGRQKSLCLVGLYTIDPDNPWGEGLPFLTLHTFPPFNIIFIVIIWKQNRKGQKSREMERKAHCGHWPTPGAEEWMGWGTKTGWRLAETHPKDWVTVCVPVAADGVVMNWNQGSAWTFSRREEGLGWEEKGQPCWPEGKHVGNKKTKRMSFGWTCFVSTGTKYHCLRLF